MRKRMYILTSISCLLIILGMTSGCATLNLSEKIDRTYTEGNRVTSIHSVYRDNNDSDKLFICFFGQEYTNDYRMLDNRKVEKSYVATIDGIKYNKYDQPILDLDSVKLVNCETFMQDKSASKLNNYVAIQYKRSKTNKSCEIIRWGRNVSVNESIIIPQDTCDFYYNRNNNSNLKTTLTNDASLSEGVFIVYMLDRPIKDSSFIVTHKPAASAIHIKYNKGVYAFGIPSERHMTNPLSPLLIPFTVVFDIVTFPFQAIVFMSVGYVE